MDSQTLRVMHLVLSLTRGGTERLVIDMCKASHNELDIVVCCLDDEGEWSGELWDLGIDVHALHRPPGFQPSISSSIRRLAAKHRTQVIHCHQYTPFVYGALARLFSPTLKLAYTEHGRFSDAKPTRKRWFANQFFGRTPGKFVAVSADLRDHLIDEGFPSGRIGVVYNGISAPDVDSTSCRERFRRELGLDDECVLFGTVARLDPVKDLGTLLHAFANVATHQNSHLVIVGDGPERADLERTADDLDLLKHSTFVGMRDNVRELLPAIDVYVNCSTFEGISVTILEAMSQGLPVVATRAGGNAELVIDGKTGDLVPARDPEALAAALSSLGRDPARRRQYGHNARQVTREKFSLETMMSSYLKCYRRLAG